MKKKYNTYLKGKSDQKGQKSLNIVKLTPIFNSL